MEIGQLEQKLEHGNHVSTDGRRRQRKRHNIIRSQNFCGRIKTVPARGVFELSGLNYV